MARKKMAVGGVQSILNRRRNYFFDENDEIVTFGNDSEAVERDDSSLT